MCFLCCVLAGKSAQLNPTNTEEQKGGLKTLAEKGMSSSKMQHDLLCQNKRLQRSLFPCSIQPHRLAPSRDKRHTSSHATSSFLSRMMLKTRKSKIPFLEENNWTGILQLPWNRIMQKKNFLPGTCKLRPLSTTKITQCPLWRDSFWTDLQFLCALLQQILIYLTVTRGAHCFMQNSILLTSYRQCFHNNLSTAIILHAWR